MKRGVNNYLTFQEFPSLVSTRNLSEILEKDCGLNRKRLTNLVIKETTNFYCKNIVINMHQSFVPPFISKNL